MAVALLGAVAISTAGSSGLDGRLDRFELRAQNEFLELYYLEDTAEIAVRVRDTGAVWFSNPHGRNTDEKIAKGAAKDRLSAQFSLTYFSTRGELKILDSYNDSVKLQQFRAIDIEDGLRVEYTLGKEWNDEAFLPVIMREESFEELILSNMSQRDRELFLSNYHCVLMVEVSEEHPAIDVYNLNPDVLGSYTLISPRTALTERNRKKLVEDFIDQIVAHRKDLRNRTSMKAESIPAVVRQEPVYVLKTSIRAFDLEDMRSLIRQSGVSPEELQRDYDLFGLDKSERNTVIFRAALEYTLDGDSLVVRVRVADLEYPKDVLDEFGQITSYPPNTIRLLEYFGAAGTQAEGYMFVPDGSGALIYLNNGKTHMPSYSSWVYGLDRALDPPQSRETLSEHVYLPVFGMKQGTQAMIGIIEGGKAASRISADIGGRADSYNKVSAAFTVLPKGVTSLESWPEIRAGQTIIKQSIDVYQCRLFLEDMVVRYTFLQDDDASYAGMARTYQDYLVSKGVLSRMSGCRDLPFLLELVGSISVSKPVLGAPRDVIRPLTTFDQAQEVVDRFLAGGVKEIALRYSGWLRGGYYHVFPDRVRVEESLGGLLALDRLCAHLEDKGVVLYPDVAFLEVYRNGLLDSFVTLRDAARYLNKKTALSHVFHPVSGQYQESKASPILSARRLPSVIQSFLREFDKISAPGLSLRVMGRQVDSDFRDDPEKLVDREQAVEIIEEQMRTITEDYGLALMVEGGNDYSLRYASLVVGAPMSSSEYNLLDASVPFYQMVLHGYVHYAGEPLNHAQDRRNARLRTIESGAIPYYQLIYEDPSEVKQTSIDHLFSMGFEGWIDEASQFYMDANRILADLQEQRIVDHRELAAGLFQTVYEDGRSVLVNYNAEDVRFGDIVVPGLDYMLVEEAPACE